MKYWILGCALLTVSIPAAPQRHAMPRGSFLAAPARSTQALLRQYDTNAEVRRRYMNIFGRTREETRVILSRLKPKDLTDSRDYPVAFYSESGKWTYRVKTLSKGTTVYVTPEGKPFLKEECGNPLVLSLPYPKGKPVASRLPIKLPVSLATPPIEVTVIPQPSPGALLPPIEEFQPPITSTTSPRFAELFPPAGGVEVSPEESPGVLSPPGVPAPPGGNPFLLLLLLPLLFLGGGGGGGGSPPPPPPPPPVVPETSSWVMMVVGGMGIGLAVWRERAIRSGLGKYGVE